MLTDFSPDKFNPAQTEESSGYEPAVGLVMSFTAGLYNSNTGAGCCMGKVLQIGRNLQEVL